jgi:hypothetical protein
MIQARLFLVAESAAIDTRFNTLSAFHIMDQINAATFPVAVPHLSVLIMLVRDQTDPSETQLQFEVYCGTQQLLAQAVPANFQQQLAMRVILDLHALLVPSPNPLRFTLRNEASSIGSWTINLNQIGEAQVQMTLPALQPAHPA